MWFGISVIQIWESVYQQRQPILKFDLIKQDLICAIIVMKEYVCCQIENEQTMVRAKISENKDTDYIPK